MGGSASEDGGVGWLLDMQRESIQKSNRENEFCRIKSNKVSHLPCNCSALPSISLTSVAARYKCAQAALQRHLILYAVSCPQVLDTNLDIRADKTTSIVRETSSDATSASE